ncbi:DUF1254 domain-containing protein [Blautia sp. HCP3S3_C4]|uniref:DUF1254 domain-containing protein n=1 Tax=Blautia sp. HCP3S3_C4 TaxID=3438911 RepID=UPI003F8B4B4F
MKRFVASADSETDKNIWETVEAAYVYTFPLVLMDATETSATNTEEAATEKAPVNQFIHSVALADAQFKTVVTPNVDTIYSQVWYDLSEEPMVYELPETDRFCKVQVLDGWTNTAAVLDKAGAYAITLSTWEGELPEGVTRIDVPTSMAWSITRIVLTGEEDLPNVYAIQEKMKLMPLSDYISGDTYEPPRGSYSEENDYIPVDKVLSMDPITFFNKANELMVKNSPAAADKEMLEKIAAVNIGPGMEFDTSVLTGDVAENWKTMLTEIQLKLIKEGQKFSKKLGQWDYFGEPIGDFNTEYAYRALVALAGLGANTVEVALYPKIEQDADGNTLTGEKSYILHFESYPQVLEGGFWSVTAYGDDDFLIDNPIDRYCINDRSDLKVNDDGSVDVILSKDAPEDTTNWLPVDNGGFHLYMRIYTPDMDALETWTAPTITEIDPSKVN